MASRKKLAIAFHRQLQNLVTDMRMIAPENGVLELFADFLARQEFQEKIMENFYEHVVLPHGDKLNMEHEDYFLKKMDFTHADEVCAMINKCREIYVECSTENRNKFWLYMKSLCTICVKWVGGSAPHDSPVGASTTQ